MNKVVFKASDKGLQMHKGCTCMGGVDGKINGVKEDGKRGKKKGAKE